MIPIPAKVSEALVRGLVGVAAIAVVVALAYGWGRGNGVESMEKPLAEERAAHAKDLAEHALVLREHAERAAHVADLARQSQTTFITERESARSAHKQELKDALARKDRIIAGLRTGALQLQPWWECPSVLPAAGSVIGADAAGDGSRADEGAYLRAAGHAENIYQFARADTWIRSLQAEVTATRKACGANPR